MQHHGGVNCDATTIVHRTGCADDLSDAIVEDIHRISTDATTEGFGCGADGTLFNVLCFHCYSLLLHSSLIHRVSEIGYS